MVPCSASRGQSYFDDDNGEGFLLLAAGVAVTTPFWAPILMTHDNYSARGYFPEYPYQHGILGNMMLDDGRFPTKPFTWSMRARIAYSDNFSGSRRIDTSLFLEGTHRLGIDSEFNYWRQSVGAGQHQDFWTGDANVLFRFAQSEWLQTRVGLGFNWLAEDASSDVGFNFTYIADLFIHDPVILSLEFDWGTLGNETLLHTRVTTGAQWHRAEVFIGYDYFDIGPTQTNSMIAGFRFWN